MMRIYSDLVVEFSDKIVPREEVFTNVENVNGVVVTRTDLTSKILAEKLGRRVGLYYTVEKSSADSKISKVLAGCIGEYDFDWSRVLLVGLGNPSFASDSLGSLVLDSIEPIEGKVCKLYPMTGGKTGIQSIDIIKATVDIVKPTLLVAIDSLATVSVDRIGVCYQLSSAGIVPGSGVGNARSLMDRDELGVDILAIGVPFVCNIRRFTRQNNMIVTPSNIESIVKACANNISNSILSVISQ